MSNERPQHFIICLSDHDHANVSDAECRGHAQQAYIPYTDAEMQQMELDAIAYATEKAEREAEETRIENLKISARAKLQAGEPLTEEEAAVLVI